MAGQKNHYSKRNVFVWFLVSIILIFALAYAVNRNQAIKEVWSSIFSVEMTGSHPAEKPDRPAQEDPTEKPDVPPEQNPSQEPAQEDPPGEPAQGCDSDKDPEEVPSKDRIYTGQQLVIPAYAGVESTVITSGMKPDPASMQIALTFDAGWFYDQTPALLDVLDQYQVKATFFLRGQWAKDHPELTKEIASRGHSVQNHSLTHGHMSEMTDEEVIREISISTEILESVIGQRPYLFRPPFGEYDERILKTLAQQNYPYTVKWTLDSLDWAEERNGIKITKQYLVERVLTGASDQGVVLMHVGGYQTVNALPEIIEGLKRDGYQLVRVDEMLPAPPPRGKDIIYTVKDGDTLTTIAEHFGTTVDELFKAQQ